VVDENYLKRLKEESYKKNLITRGLKNEEIVNKEEPKVDINLKYKFEIDQFKLMLEEKNISKYSSYEKEIPKLIYDKRYLCLPIELRIPIFEDYQNSIKFEEKVEKVEKVVEKRKGFENFKLLIKKAVETGFLNITTSFAEFQQKYQDDSSFIDLYQRDKEFLFNEAKLKLKKLLDESILFLN
jgi:transcription elongation regulator 1